MDWKLLFLCCLIGLHASLGRPAEENEGDSEDPGEYGDLFEGDIMLPRHRNGEPSSRKRWPNGEVPYVIDSSVDSRGRSVLNQAFAYYRQNTCIRLVPRTSQRNHVVFKTPASGCNSYVGMTGNAQTINLAKGCFNAIGTVLHEIMHALGFGHEMAREDRDNFINIHLNNIQDKYKYAFNVRKGSLTYGTKYDIRSVMQYGSKAFSKNGQYTITPKDGSSPSLLGQRKELTSTDLYKVNAMYQCGGGSVKTQAPVTRPPVTQAPPVTTTCVNAHSACEHWASAGECQKNPNYMLSRCKKACNVCRASVARCVDKHSSCAGWASRSPSECENNPRYMLYSCEKSCKVCGARVGCFQQTSLQNGISHTSTLMSPNYCQRYCGQRNYKYAGLKNGKTCYCAATYGQGPMVGDGQCAVKCAGRSGVTCGGTDKVEVYDV